MSKRYEKYRHNRAMLVHTLREKGYTTSEIADAVGCDPHQVKSLVSLGERIKSLEAESA